VGDVGCGLLRGNVQVVVGEEGVTVNCCDCLFCCCLLLEEALFRCHHSQRENLICLQQVAGALKS